MTRPPARPSVCRRSVCPPVDPASRPPGYGVKKISTVNMRASQYVPIHSKQIRGLAFNRRDDSLMLSASLDNTLKITRSSQGPRYTPCPHRDLDTHHVLRGT